MTDLEKAARMALEWIDAQPEPRMLGALRAITALRQALEQPAQQEPWADKCRIELITAIHFLASDFENALGAFGGDTEARRKAEGDIAHARIVASRWNWNGTTRPAPQEPVGYVYSVHGERTKNACIKSDVPNGTPLYILPQRKRVPLPTGEYEAGWNSALEMAAFKLQNDFKQAFGADTLASIAVYIKGLKK